MKQPPWPKPAEYLESHPDPKGLLFYPGAGTDYGPLRLFAGHGNYARVVYCDYGLSREDALAFMKRIPGWKTTACPSDIAPRTYLADDWSDLWSADERARTFQSPTGAFGLQATLTSSTGQTFVLDYLGTEAVATYGRLCANGQHPTAVVLQDHGFGGGWTPFGGAEGFYTFCAVEAATRRSDGRVKLPPLTFTAQESHPWPGYTRVTRYLGYEGAMHKNKRAIFKCAGDILHRSLYIESECTLSQ